MKQKLLATVLLLFIFVIAACGSDDGQGTSIDRTYDEADFNISLPDTSENMVNISPDGKTIYAYFTGIGWQICIAQLVELEKYTDNELKGVKLYAISPSSPEEHEMMKKTFKLDSFEVLTDYNYEFGETFGFVDFDENSIYRGYLGVNPETENMIIEIDYLIGDKIKEVLRNMEEL
jgi:peroxiredoxin